ECPPCLLPQPPQAFPSLAPCHHRSCQGCLEQYLGIAVSESRVTVACPHCPAMLQPANVRRLLAEPALRDKYEEFLLRRLLAADPGTRWCPAPDCPCVIAYGCAECPHLTCGHEGCGTKFCYHCRQPWHPDSPCVPVPPAPGLANPMAQLEDPASGETLAQAGAQDWDGAIRLSAPAVGPRVCPRVGAGDAGVCVPCVGAPGPALAVPSGCTFWGKRPWSQTWKILWQLGMVPGAPVVISLIAGIAVPVVTIRIPTYMGRKVLVGALQSSLSGCQRCLPVTSSVLLARFVSPIVTAVTVG
ncbi:RN19A ligase, partial [Corythaeola cristata]|nr:RN19A ligase [Corythaeola cristata]